MEINKKEIFKINGVYTSALWKDWYAAEFFVHRDGHVFRLRIPYKTKVCAQQMVQYLKGNMSKAPAPDYEPHIHIIKNGRVR